MKTSDFKEMWVLWKRVESGLNLKDVETERREAIAMIRLNKDSCFVAIKKGRIIGTIFGVFNGRRAWLYHLAVDPMYQRTGIGSALVKKAEEVLLKVGANKIRLWLEESNKQVGAFYKKHGYKEIPSTILGKDFPF